MSDELSEVFGDDFAQDYQSERQEREQARRRVDEETLKEICFKAVQGDGFSGSEPRFTYTADAVDHDVFLLQAPENKFEKFKNPYDDGGMSVGMFYVGDDIYSCSFSEDMMQLVEKIEEGKHYIVIGNFEEARVEKGGETNIYFNLNPVRGIVPVKVAKKWAQQRSEEKSGSSVEEQKEDQGVDDSESSAEVTDSDIMNVFNAVKKRKSEVLRNVADGDEEALSKLTALADNNLDGDVTEEHVREVFESEIEEIDDGEDEEDDMDLGDLDTSSDDEDDSSEEESSDDETEPEESESDDEDEDGIDDWF